MKRSAQGFAVAAIAAVCLSGCSDVEVALNDGGDTTCNEWATQDQNKQRQTITKFLKEYTGSDNEPAGTQVDASMVAVTLLCQVQSDKETQIKNVNLTGILPK